jgi:hypothetical protein
MKHEHQKALFILASGLILFWIFKPKIKKPKESELNFSGDEKDPSAREKIKDPTVDPKSIEKNEKARNGFAALKAYVAAYNNKEPQKVLDELNREFAKEFKVKVYRRKSDDKLVVCDLEGKEIIVNG